MTFIASKSVCCDHQFVPNGAERHGAFRWALLAAALGLAAMLAAFPAHAAYPERAIRWIVPAAPAGGADAAARIVADQLARRLGQPIVIENKPGASGAIGLDAVAKAPPDGYTIGTANITNLVLNRQLRPNLPFNPDKDLVALAKLTSQPNVLVVNTSLPAQDVRELIAYAKARPDALFYGSSGSGSSLHIAGEYLKQVAGIQMTHVAYKSAPAADADLMANNIQVIIDNFTTLAPYIKSGKLKALAVTAPARSASLPQVPTMKESGGPDFQMVVWGGVVTPAGLPPAITKRLSDELLAVLAMPEVRARLAELGYEPDPQGPAAFANFVKAENQRWGEVIRRANIKAD